MPNFIDGFALLIGVANYQHINSLSDRVLNDARAMEIVLSDPLYCGYPTDQIKVLLDATREEILTGLKWLSNTTDKDSTVVIFFSGHGAHIPLIGNYLLPQDFEASKVAETAIYSDELTALIQDIQAERLVVILDACHAGGIGEIKESSQQIQLKDGLTEDLYELLAKGTGRVIMAACRPNEKSLILPNMSNSLFTAYLLEALRGKAGSEDENVIRVFDIFEYVSNQVVSRTNIQHPNCKSFVENNFPVALRLQSKSESPINQIGNVIKKPKADTSELRKRIVMAFNLEELDLLCADVEALLRKEGVNLPIGAEISGGLSLEGKVHKIITYLERRNYLGFLIEAIAATRPNLLKD